MNFDKDYYVILGVLPSAEDFLIKAAYRVLSQKYHPDKFKEPKQKAKYELKIKAINEAYTVLSDVKKRKQYDDFLKKNNRQNEFYEEEPVESGSSELVNEVDWVMTVEYLPELKGLYNNLKLISPNLAFNFKLYILRDKSFDEAKEVAEELEESFFSTFFGDDRSIVIFASFLLKNGHRDAAQELNKAIKLFERKIKAKKIIKKICLKHNINRDFKVNKKDKKKNSYPRRKAFVDNTDTLEFGEDKGEGMFLFFLLIVFIFIYFIISLFLDN